MFPGPVFNSHKHLYAIEAALLACFMISAAAFTMLFELPQSPMHRAIASADIRRTIIGAAMGTTAIVLIYSRWGKQSGAHMNPAITFAFLWLKRISFTDALGYWIGQFTGGVLGMLICRSFARPWVADAAVNYVVTIPGSRGVIIAWIAEFVISFALQFTVLTVNASRWMSRTGYVAGFLVFLYITFEAPLSGMSMNPSRTLGSAVSAQLFTGLWVYFTAPLLGMISAIEFRQLLGTAKHSLCGRLNHCPHTVSIFQCNCLGHSIIQTGESQRHSKEKPCPTQTITT